MTRTTDPDPAPWHPLGERVPSKGTSKPATRLEPFKEWRDIPGRPGWQEDGFGHLAVNGNAAPECTKPPIKIYYHPPMEEHESYMEMRGRELRSRSAIDQAWNVPEDVVKARPDIFQEAAYERAMDELVAEVEVNGFANLV